MEKIMIMEDIERKKGGGGEEAMRKQAWGELGRTEKME